MSDERRSAGRVLIVEDEAIVAMLLEDMLVEMGFDVVGPVARLDRAIALVRAAPIDAAILDMNLNGESTDPLADLLRERDVPFVLATGYSAKGLTGRDAPILQKPFQADDLSRALNEAMARKA